MTRRKRLGHFFVSFQFFLPTFIQLLREGFHSPQKRDYTQIHVIQPKEFTVKMFFVLAMLLGLSVAHADSTQTTAPADQAIQQQNTEEEGVIKNKKEVVEEEDKKAEEATDNADN